VSDRYEKYKEARRRYDTEYRVLNKEKIAERKRQYWKKNKKKIYLKRGVTQRKLSKATKQWQKHKSEIDEVVRLYLVVRKFAVKTFYEKINKPVAIDEMWRRYKALKIDFEDMQRMKKAA
jgi:hypothetical protein